MNGKFFNTGIAAIAAALTLCSCNLNNDDEEEVDTIQFVTVESVSASDIGLRLDNGELLTVELGESTSATSPAVGARSLAYYRKSPLPNRLYSIAEVPVGNIEKLTAENAETIGNDSTYYINICYVGADYLNVYFSSGSTKKEMNLIYNPEMESNADTAYLQLRYNANGINGQTNSSAPISFKLDELRTEGKDSVVIYVDTKSTNSSGKIAPKRYNFVQKWGN